MTFLIISHILHKELGKKYFAYGPYVREMNLWLKYPEKVVIVAPLLREKALDPIDIVYDHQDIDFIPIPQFNIQGPLSLFRTLFLLPVLVSRIIKGIRLADHIHLRCPGNVGLIGCLVQIFFSKKAKTAKYSGNWDWNSKQPLSYRLQQSILRNTFLTHNMTALVYGDWPDRTKNIKPFLTASYSEKERLPVYKTPMNEEVKFAFVGTLTENKNPLACAEILKIITERGINASLTYCGDGPERQKIKEYVDLHRLQDKVKSFGNVNSEIVKHVLQEAHFLIFISRSEGWPKAVSEAMWWGCVPVATPVSCVPWMLDNGIRGELVNGEVTGITSMIEGYISDQDRFNSKSDKAMVWSRGYTLERFEREIKQLFKIEDPSAN